MNFKSIHLTVSFFCSYPVLEDDEIQQIPLENYINSNSIVLIWVTNSETHITALKQKILPKWKLKLISTCYWIKIDRTGQLLTEFNNVQMKQPYELLFVCTHQENEDLEGKIEANKIFFSIPSSIHSHKPDLFNIFSKYLPDNPVCLELFARGLRENFTSVGIEVLLLQNLKLFEEL